jgi:hypothetical protein
VLIPPAFGHSLGAIRASIEAYAYHFGCAGFKATDDLITSALLVALLSVEQSDRLKLHGLSPSTIEERVKLLHGASAELLHRRADAVGQAQLPPPHVMGI